VADPITPEQSRMLAAHASRYLWGEEVSRVYCLLGRAEPALHHAQRCLDECLAHDLAGFDLAYAHEALARAQALAGDRAAAAGSRGRAEQAATAIEDADDRALLVADLATLPA